MFCSFDHVEHNYVIAIQNRARTKKTIKHDCLLGTCIFMERHDGTMEVGGMKIWTTCVAGRNRTADKLIFQPPRRRCFTSRSNSQGQGGVGLAWLAQMAHARAPERPISLASLQHFLVFVFP